MVGFWGYASKEGRLTSCYSPSLNQQVFTPAFESQVLFINRTDKDLVRTTFSGSGSGSGRASACRIRIHASLAGEAGW